MLKVITVKKGENAELSGILSNDLLLKYDGITINNREDLLELISRVNKRIFTNSISIEIDRDGVLIVVVVRSGILGLVLKPENIEIDAHNADNYSIEKANSIIRLANQRVSELKQLIAERDVKISHLQEENNRFSRNIKSDITGFSDFSDNAILGVSETTSLEIIKKNYKKLSMIYHPDRGGSPHMMKLINATFERLKRDESV